MDPEPFGMEYSEGGGNWRRQTDSFGGQAGGSWRGGSGENWNRGGGGGRGAPWAGESNWDGRPEMWQEEGMFFFV